MKRDQITFILIFTYYYLISSIHLVFSVCFKKNKRVEVGMVLSMFQTHTPNLTYEHVVANYQVSEVKFYICCDVLPYKQAFTKLNPRGQLHCKV